MDAYKRPQAATLAQRLSEPRRFLQVVAGPRQVGKTTLVQQVLETRKESSFFQSADEPTLQDPSWIRTHWETARIQAKTRGTILVLDEIQKIPGWAGTVKHLWDEDTRCRVPLKLIVLGSAPLLVTRVFRKVWRDALSFSIFPIGVRWKCEWHLAGPSTRRYFSGLSWFRAPCER